MVGTACGFSTLLSWGKEGEELSLCSYYLSYFKEDHLKRSCFIQSYHSLAKLSEMPVLHWSGAFCNHGWAQKCHFPFFASFFYIKKTFHVSILEGENENVKACPREKANGLCPVTVLKTVTCSKI